MKPLLVLAFLALSSATYAKAILPYDVVRSLIAVKGVHGKGSYYKNGEAKLTDKNCSVKLSEAALFDIDTPLLTDIFSVSVAGAHLDSDIQTWSENAISSELLKDGTLVYHYSYSQGRKCQHDLTIAINPHEVVFQDDLSCTNGKAVSEIYDCVF